MTATDRKSSWFDFRPRRGKRRSDVQFRSRRGTVIPKGLSIVKVFSTLEPHGAASCRFATRPVLRTRPGHPRLGHTRTLPLS